MGDYLHGGGTNRIYLIGQIESEEKKTKGTHRIKSCHRSAATTGTGWCRARGDLTCLDGEMGDSRRVESHGGSFDFGQGKLETSAAHTFEKSNQQPAMHQNMGQKDRLCSGYLIVVPVGYCKIPCHILI